MPRESKINETTQEEFARRVHELYELAGKMGLHLTLTVKSKPGSVTTSSNREPGEN